MVPPPAGGQVVQLLVFAQPTLVPEWEKERRKRRRLDDEDVFLL